MRTLGSRASSPSETAAVAASDENTENTRLPTPRSPAVRDPQIPIVALAKRPRPSRGFLLGRLSSAGPSASPTVAKGRRPKPFTRAEVRQSTPNPHAHGSRKAARSSCPSHRRADALGLEGSRRGAGILLTASATHNDDSLLKNAVSGGNLSFAEASIGRISVESFAETDPPQNVHLVRCRESRPDDESLDRMQKLMFQNSLFRGPRGRDARDDQQNGRE